jgi:hypothetical protein
MIAFSSGNYHESVLIIGKLLFVIYLKVWQIDKWSHKKEKWWT